MTERHWGRLVLGAGALVFYVFFGHEVLWGRSVFTHDTIHWYGVFSHFVLSLGRGLIPLWDPYSLNGAPFYFLNNMTGNMDPTVIGLAPLARYLGISTLDLYQWHYIARLLFFWLGIYLLYKRVSKDRICAALASTLSFLLFVPNSFWQHGSTLCSLYVPWFVWCGLGVIDPKQSALSRKQNLFFGLFFLGLTFNQYLPSYGLVFSSLVLGTTILSGPKPREILVRSLSDLKSKWGLGGMAVCAILTGPFLYSAFQLIPNRGDYFNFHRMPDPTVSVLASESDLGVTSQEDTVGSETHNLWSLLFTSIDTRKFLDTTGQTAPINEHFLTLGPAGFCLLILAFVFGLRRRELWIFGVPLIFITLMMYLPSDSALLQALRLYPSAGVIHLTYNFLGLWFVAFGGVCLSALQWLRSQKQKRETLLIAGLAFGLQFTLIAIYLKRLREGWGMAVPSSEMVAWSEEAAYGFVLGTLGFALAMAGYLSSRKTWLRQLSALAAVSLCLINIVYSYTRIQPYVLQPAAGWRQGPIHYDRPFIYPKIRVPVLPLFADTQAFEGPLFRIAQTYTSSANPYGTFTRRMHDYLRFVSHEKQILLSGIGTNRFGFFTSYTPVSSPRAALAHIDQSKLHDLAEILTVETEGTEFADLNKAEVKNPRAVDALNPRAILEPWWKYYSKRTDLDFGKITTQKRPWSLSDLGNFHYLLFPDTLEKYNQLHYFPNPGVVFKNKDEFCFKRLHDWYLRGARTGFYPKLISEPPEFCDIDLAQGTIQFSNELRGPFITNETIDPQVRDQRPKNISRFEFENQGPRLPTSGARMEVKEFTPNGISFLIEAPRSGLFYYADSFSRDWHAHVDHQLQPIYVANSAYKSVYLTAGQHQVEFIFQPRGYVFLFWLFSLVSLATTWMYAMWMRKDAQWDS